MNHTENHGLPQWEKEDRIQMEDFNAAMATIDAALPKILIGTYTGNGATERFVELPFTPKAVLVTNSNGQVADNSDPLYYYGGLATTNCATPALSIGTNGFTVRYYINTSKSTFHMTNSNNVTYNYIAIG